MRKRPLNTSEAKKSRLASFDACPLLAESLFKTFSLLKADLSVVLLSFTTLPPTQAGRDLAANNSS
jgi:hypothetical protein